MGIVAFCPNGHRIKVKDEFAGRKGICPTCSARFRIPRKALGSGAAPDADGLERPPTARVVPLDPTTVESLPAAFALDEADTVGAADPADAAPDFVAVTEEDEEVDAAFVGAPVGGEHASREPAATDSRPTHPILDERPDLAWCVAIRGGAPSAPLDETAMRTWLSSGEASDDHVVWRQDWPEWRPLREVFPQALPAGPPRWP